MAGGDAKKGGLPPVDRRQEKPRDLNTPVPPPRFTTKAAWAKRRAALREQVLNAAGLLPMPEKTPLNPRIFGRLERDGYSVEKVVIETRPGLFLGGNLYRPLGRRDRKFPGILTPHGHWGRGRLADEAAGSVPARCITFARQGYVVFSYDMTGYNDTGIGLEHRRFAATDPRPALWGISVFGLQTWNSVRALDFLLSLPDVDRRRIGVTGESGGGTQTFILTAIDDRMRAAAPVNMISLHMQGGCLCENAPGLRIDTNNVEIGAMMAPKPMLMIAATGDWTKDTPRLEGPATRNAYILFGAEDSLRWVQIDAGHNYNKASREAVYPFFGRLLLNDRDPEHFKEPPYKVDSDADLRAFPDGKPPAGAVTEPQLIAQMIEEGKRLWRGALPKDARSLAAFRKTYGAALRHSLAVEMPAASAIVAETGGATGDGVSVDFGRRGSGDRVEATLYTGREKAGVATLVAHDSRRPDGLVRRLRDNGRTVLLVKPFRFETPRDPRANFFTGYNRTELANRVQDILTGIAYLKKRGHRTVELVGVDRAGLWALLARAFAPDVARTVCDVDGLDTASDDGFAADLWQPGIRRAGDFRTAGILAAPGALYLHNTQGRFDAAPVEDAYRLAGARLEVSRRHTDDEGMVAWLARED